MYPALIEMGKNILSFITFTIADLRMSSVFTFFWENLYSDELAIIYVCIHHRHENSLSLVCFPP